MIQLTEKEYMDLRVRALRSHVADDVMERSIRLARAAQNVVDVYKRPYVWKRRDAMRRLENELEGKS